MNRLREKVASLETDYKLAKLKQKEEAQKAQTMSERIKVLEKDLTLEKPLGQTKEMLWANIIDSVNDIWPSIQVIFLTNRINKYSYRSYPEIKGGVGRQA